MGAEILNLENNSNPSNHPHEIREERNPPPVYNLEFRMKPLEVTKQSPPNLPRKQLIPIAMPALQRIQPTPLPHLQVMLQPPRMFNFITHPISPPGPVKIKQPQNPIRGIRGVLRHIAYYPYIDKI